MRAKSWFIAAGAGSAIGACSADHVDAANETAFDAVVTVDIISRDDGPEQPDVALVDIAAPSDAPSTDLPLVDVAVSDVGAADTNPTDVRDIAQPEVKVPDTFVKEDVTTVEDVTPTLGYRWVRITDDKTNTSLLVCIPGGTPGADIDAIEVLRDDAYLAYADQVIADLDKDPNNKGQPCENTANVGESALGSPDADAGGAAVSLNGGSITLRLSDDASMQVGDVLKVYESAASVAGLPERYDVAIAQLATGPWVTLGNFEGPAEITVALPTP